MNDHLFEKQDEHRLMIDVSRGLLGIYESIEGLEKMIERDAEFITQKLDDILGPGKRQNFGQGSAKRKVTRWDWNDHSFLVSVAEGEFVSLSIDKIEVADKRGRQSKVADMHLRRVHEANVEKRDNYY